MINIELTPKEFRRLLDMVYIGNWILNSTRSGDERFHDYDEIEKKIFSYCEKYGFGQLYKKTNGSISPSNAYKNGGIHEAIIDYEDSVFFEILAEELARKDMEFEPVNSGNIEELSDRIDNYMAEFEENGIENLHFDK